MPRRALLCRLSEKTGEREKQGGREEYQIILGTIIWAANFP